MRRGRIIGGFVALLVAMGLGFAVAPHAATAASPMDICHDLSDGVLNGSYSQADLAAYQDALQHDPTVQGYCTSIVIVPVCTTPDSNGNCGGTTTTTTTTTTTSVCVYTGSNGQTTTTTSGSPACAPPPTTSTTGVAGTQHTESTPPSSQPTTTAGVAGATKTKTQPPTSNAAPLAATRSAGTLPFTGVQLTVFAVVGLALLAGGFLLRLSARQKKSDV